MRAGKLRYRITIQAPVHDVDEFGGVIDDWADLATIRAELVQQSTREFLRGQGAVDDELVVFRTRHVEGVTNAMRVLFQGIPHNIREVAPDALRRHMELRTTSRRAEA